MKFSIVLTTLFTFFTVSLAVPIASYGTTEDLLARGIENIDALSTREWIDLYARTGSFAETNETIKKKAHVFIQNALTHAGLGRAASPGISPKTYRQTGIFHLDRQQPENTDGLRKVAIQLNLKNQGRPTTIGQVVIHKDAHPSDKTVAAKLKLSVDSGREQIIKVLPPTKKQQNIAKNEVARKAKQDRLAKAAAVGKAKQGRIAKNQPEKDQTGQKGK